MDYSVICNPDPTPAIQKANQLKLRKNQVCINILVLRLQCNMQSRPHSPAIQEANQLKLRKNRVHTNKNARAWITV